MFVMFKCYIIIVRVETLQAGKNLYGSTNPKGFSIVIMLFLWLQSFAIGCLFVHFKVSLYLFVTKHGHVGLLRRNCGVYQTSANKMIKITQN